MAQIKVGYYSFFPAGGIGQYSHYLCLELSRNKDVDVTLICTRDYQWRKSSGVKYWDGLLKFNNDNKYLRKMLFLIAQFVNPVRALNYAKRNGIEILHFSQINIISFFFWRYFIYKECKIIVTAHDVLRGKAILNRKFETRMLKEIYRRSDIIFVHSKFQVEQLVSFSGIDRNKTHIVPMGAYFYEHPTVNRVEERAKLGFDGDEVVGLFFGQIRDDKNLENLLQSIVKSNESTHLLVAGNPGDRHKNGEYYRKIVQSLGIDYRVHFIFKYISDAEVANLFLACDWVALTYESKFTSQSAVLNVAAFFKRPILVSNAPVIRETVSESGIGVVCDGDDVKSIEAGVGTMVTKIQQQEEFPFHEYDQKYSWSRNAELTVATYRSLSRVLK